MYPANNGDAFLISASGSNVLIDGGYAKTFDDHISKDLLDLSHRGERLDLVIASHIDADHISGLIRLLSLNGASSSPRFASIGEIWHNSLRSLTSKSYAEMRPSDRDILNAIRQRGHRHTATELGTVAVEVSARQGSTLASLIHKSGYKWNLGDGARSITNGTTLPLPNGTVHVIGPQQERLDGLLKQWKRQLLQMGYSGPVKAGDVIDDAFELMCEHTPDTTSLIPTPLSAGGYKQLHEVYEPDTSITNGSSITAVIELDGVRILMLSDAWAEDMVDALRTLQSQGHSMMFDMIKVSHHGSLRNTSPKLLELIDAPIYMVSSNGARHGHPDFEVLAAIVDRAAGFSRSIYLNYSTAASKRLREHQSQSNTPFTVHENVTDWITIGRT